MHARQRNLFMPNVGWQCLDQDIKTHAAILRLLEEQMFVMNWMVVNDGDLHKTRVSKG